MAFSILVGLALDYDIFLINRMIQYREMGWSDRASACLAIEKTAGIINAAGLIMMIAFAGMLIPKTVVLNQYGFILFIGVGIDTYIMRPLIVPAIVAAGGGLGVTLNWWPSSMPDVVYASVELEYEALLEGLDRPERKAKPV